MIEKNIQDQREVRWAEIHAEGLQDALGFKTYVNRYFSEEMFHEAYFEGFKKGLNERGEK